MRLKLGEFHYTLSLHTCNGTVLVCGFSSGPQENWLITQHTSRDLPGGQRLGKVTIQFDLSFSDGCRSAPQCRESFDVYKWQTSTVNKTAATNTDNYISVDRIILTESTTEYHLDVSLDAESGFYLAIVDFGTCVSIERILVLYYVCPSETSQLISRPEAIGSETPVDGECVQNSFTLSGAAPVLVCGDMSQWQVLTLCFCDPGYEFDDD